MLTQVDWENPQLLNFSNAVLALLEPSLGGGCLSSVYLHCCDSILHDDNRDKCLCRVIDVFKRDSSLYPFISEQITAKVLGDIIDHIDTITPRNHLYEKELLEQCGFIVQNKVDIFCCQLEDLLQPVKQYKANILSGYFTNQCLWPGLMIVLLLALSKRSMRRCWGYDLASMIYELYHCSYDKVDSVFRTAIQNIALVEVGDLEFESLTLDGGVPW